MLRDRSAWAIVAVSDMDRSRRFYVETLGLELLDSGMDGVTTLRTGDTRLVIYRSDEAGTNTANAVVWSCGDEVEAIVADLEAKGVQFEHYPGLGGLQLRGNTHVAGAMKLVWLKDPDGNILHLNGL